MDFKFYTTKWMHESKLYDKDCEGREKKKCTRQATILKNVNPNNHP